MTNTPPPEKKTKKKKNKKKIQKARKKCENDEALDVGRIVLDNKLQTGDSSEASAQQQVNNKKRKEIILTK